MKIIIGSIAALACQMAIAGGPALAGEIIIDTQAGTVVTDPATSNSDRAKGYAGNPTAGVGSPNVIVVTPEGQVQADQPGSSADILDRNSARAKSYSNPNAPQNGSVVIIAPDGNVVSGSVNPRNSNGVLDNNSARAQSYARPQQNGQAPTVVIIAPDAATPPALNSDVQRNNMSSLARNRARAKAYSGGVTAQPGSTVVIVPNQSGGATPGLINRSAAEQQLDANSARAEAWQDGRHGCSNATVSSIGTVGGAVIVGSSANADGVNTTAVGGGCR